MGKTPIDKTTCHFREMAPEPVPEGSSSADAATVRTPVPPEDNLAASIREVEEKLLGPSGEAEKDPLVGTTVGPYRVNAFLGVGGMGRVYRATDTRLKRTVALKFLRVNDPESVARLLKEAQALAKLDHTHVCRVYDVGEIEGKPYIAMQYIDGVSLSQQAGHLYQEQKLRLVKAVAEGLGEAHRLGLVHRDIKPGNVMLEKAASGAWKPFVMDFGLARDTGEKGVSVTGEVVGTPLYMAPEQASGRVHEIGPRTDVYALGATLYELLAGQPLWSADNPIAIFASIVLEEPRPLRSIDRRIPEDLETVVMKCLEKDPAKRYADAAELAADLGRYLEGEPITARRASVAYRAWKKVRKHKAVAILALVSLALLATLSVLWARSAYLSARKVELAALFDREVRYVESFMAWVKSRPLHDTREELAFLRARLDRIRARMEREGPVALGPGHYALGRGLLALGDLTPARDHLRRAAEAYDFRTPDVCYYLGLTLMSLYQVEDRRIQVLDPAERPAALGKAIRELRNPALDYLREGRAVMSASPEYVEALLAFREGKSAAAEAKAREGLARFPWQADIQGLLTSILIERAPQPGAPEAPGNASTPLAQAAALVDDLVRRYPSDSEPRKQRMHLLYIHTKERLRAGDLAGAEKLLEQSRQERRACLVIDPAAAAETIMVLHIEFILSEHLIQNGIDSAPPVFDEGLREARKLVAASPALPEGYLFLGAFLQLRANALPSSDHPRAVALLEEATAVLRKGEALAGEGGANFSVQLGNTRFGQSRILAAQGKDPGPALDEAIQAYRRALRVLSEEALMHQNLGVALLTKIRWELKAGRDPTPLIAEAKTSLGRALALDPDLELPGLGTAMLLQAEVAWDLLAGKDPQRPLDALRDLAAAPGLKGPARKQIFFMHFDTLVNLVFNDLSGGKDPRATLGEAVEALRNWETAAPASEPHNLTRLHFHYVEAQARLAKQESPFDALSAGETILETMISRQNKPNLFLYRARFHRLRGEYARMTGKSPDKEYRAAEAALGLVSGEVKPELSASLTAESATLLLDRALEAPDPIARRTLAVRASDTFREARARYALIALEYGPQIQRAREIAGNR
ncbi:MAG: serine/threonine protein kinase [Acidobacteria bacterium]|nr:serine/threonine protein kinase [Acidobacteriota bacterium]